MDGRLDRWIDGRTGRRTDRRRYGWVDRWIEKWMGGWMYERIGWDRISLFQHGIYQIIVQETLKLGLHKIRI